MRKSQSAIILLGILLLAALVRLWGITYGLPCTYCRPDEDRLISIALSLSFQDLNPHFFKWPGLFFYFARGVLEAYSTLSVWLGENQTVSSLAFYRENPSPFHLVLRFIFCGFGVASVFFLFRLGKKMFSVNTGLLAAFFLALSFLHARESHFAMLDIPATLFSLIFFLGVMGIYKRGRWGDYAKAGIFCGLAFATKYYAVLLLLPLMTSHILYTCNRQGRKFLTSKILVSVLLVGAVFLLTSPYIILDFDSCFRDVMKEKLEQYQRGHGPIPEVRTSRGGIYHLTFSLHYALGWPLELLCLLGVIWSVYQAFRSQGVSLLLIMFVIPFYVLLTFQRKCFIRYTVIILPYLCLMGAQFFDRLRERFFLVRGRLLGLILVILLVGEPSYRIIRHNLLLTRPDSRIISSTWMEENIPLESGLLFPRPLIFGRPFASFRYPYRISLPKNEKTEFIKELLPFSSRGVEYLIIDEHPLAYSYLEQETKRLLTEGADLIYRLDAYDQNKPGAIYDPFDAYYVPLAGFNSVNFPGPNIRIYRLR